MIHFYILVGQDKDCTCAERTLLWVPNAFHTCSKNTTHTRTIVLCITQFGLEIKILVSYSMNKIDVLNPNQDSKHLFYWWAGNELTFLLPIYFQLPFSPCSVRGLYASYRINLLIIKVLKELYLRNSKVHIENNSQKKTLFFQRSTSSLPLLPFPLCHALKTCRRLYFYKMQLYNQAAITIVSSIYYTYYSSLIKSRLHIQQTIK